MLELLSHGTLTSLAVSGATTAAAITSSGTIIASVVNAGTIGNASATLTGTLSTASQTNITGVGTVTTGTWSASFGAVSGANLTSLTAGNLSGTIPSGVLGNSTHYIGTTAIALNRGSANQSLTGINIDGTANNITAYTINQSVGTANSPTFTGVTLPSITKNGTSGTGDIGATGNRFGTVWATTFSGVSTTAQYADLAENYASDAEYEPGTVVVFGGDEEITTTNIFADVRVAGAISTNPAYLMNSEFAGQAVALRGRIPIKVMGPVQKGDLLVTAGQNPGYATSIGKSTEYPLAVFAKAIETNTDTGKKIITAVII